MRITMKRTILLFGIFLLVSVSVQVSAQNGVRNIKEAPVSSLMFEATYALQFPALDTKTIYGFNSTIGGSVDYKTDENWLFKLNGNFIFGNKLKGDRQQILGEGITTEHGELIGSDGMLSRLAISQRGFHFQGEMGKMFPFKPNPNSGFYVLGGVGYLLNRTRIEDQFTSAYPILEDYRLGYDRMRGGFACHGEAGYMVMSNSCILNFSIALEVTYAKTRDLRDYDFRVFFDEHGVPHPVGRTDPDKRYNDMYFGIRLGWMIPTYQRQPDQYYYN